MTIRLQLDRIPAGTEVGPHRHGVETVVYVATGELVFEHGEHLDRRAVVRAGDVLYEAPSEYHVVRNEGTIDVLALLASVEPDSHRLGVIFRRWDDEAEPVRPREEAMIVRRGGVQRRLIVRAGDFDSSTFAITEVEIEPGHSDDWHRHLGAEHALVVFEGRGIVTVGNVSETLQPMSGIRVQAGVAHRVENTGRTPLRYYVCGSPAVDPTLDREPVEAPPRRLDA